MFTLSAEKRNIFGKKLNKIRKEGKIPAILYGIKKENAPLFLLKKEFEKIFRSAGESSVIELLIDQEQRENVIISDIQNDPIQDDIIHIDFKRVEMDKPIKVAIPLVFGGEAGCQKLGGTVVKVLHEIEVEALPKDLPHEIKVDLAKLENFGDKITIADLSLPFGVRPELKEDEIICLAEGPTKEEEAPAEIKMEEIEVVGKKEKEEKEKEEKAKEGKE